jgi:hypothetical protein
MYAINELTKKKSNLWGLTRGIVYKDKNYIEFGYFKPTPDFLRTNYDGKMYYDIRKNLDTIEVFSLLEGKIKKFIKEDPEIEEHLNVFGNGRYPYTIEREYEAEKHIELFKYDDSLNISEDKFYSFTDELKYSFGIEFETAAGYLPESKCFELGLIPLRDGSISGVEYSTIPMSDNEGICLLKRQLEALKKYTYTNKECSVHIHMGGYPVNAKAIFTLHQLWYYIQYQVGEYAPKNSFYTNYFKGNGKNYCGPVNYFENFKEMYKAYTNQSYFGDLYQPHPNDIEKRAKWNIKTRYFNCNFINMLCYDCAKTVEFRFLTPTYSYEKLTTFLMIFNAILQYAENFYNKNKEASDSKINDLLSKMYDCGKLTLISILSNVYSSETCEWLFNNLKKLRWVRQNQSNAGDDCGVRLDIENKFFPDGQ